ncbi:MAG: zf-TFIIB domain-containing protein [Ilumatobacteraceae bacterium]
MNCPTCTDERLVLAERSGIEIDYCPSCRGVWLDRGELDKLIERASAPTFPAPAPAAARTADRDRSGEPPRRYDDDDDDDNGFSWGKGNGKGKPKKKSSFLSELFEF